MSQVNREERRECTRLKSRLEARIHNLAVTTTNISESGIQISCPVVLAGELIRALEDQPVLVTMTFADGTSICVACSVSYFQDYDDEYLAGLKFVDFQADGFSILEQKCRYFRKLAAGAA